MLSILSSVQLNLEMKYSKIRKLQTCNLSINHIKRITGYVEYPWIIKN